ncbi:small RNA degrading nuclease 5 [Drosophila eugracilis]|uniref:small RNA degrading nuclease 5 n=1 Tax=Drosophila eugracilis TaxID=29029 RepID=UPI001BDA4590|nr:small RNA degrading nuclease 5 [Drosophila eugracilis]
MMWTRTRLALRSIARSQSLNGKRTRMKEQLSAKQHERNEKKKKKLAALANLMELNDRDRLHEAELAKKRDAMEAEIEEQSPAKAKAKDEDDGFITVGSKRKARNRLTIRSNPEQEAESVEEPQTSAIEHTDTDEPVAKKSRNHEAGGDSLPQEICSLSEQQYKQLSAELRRRKRQIEDVPALRLREMGQRASLATPQNARTPLFLTDIQNLLMSALIGQKSPCRPDRWCSVEKWLNLSHSVVVILEGLSLYHYLSNESQFEATNKIFNTKLEMLLPPRNEGQIIDEIAKIPLTNVQARKLIDEHGSLESAVELNKDPTLFVKTIFPIERKATVPDDLHKDDKFPRTKLLLSALQMVDEGYPIPLQGELHSRFQKFRFTKDSYAPVTNRSPMYGVDCEMCQTEAGVNELTRISIVNERYQTVYETLVMPRNRITDYLTQYSGITEEIMKKVTKTLKDVQDEVSELLPPDAILVGQSLNSDLNAMQMMHPYVIDTSVCFNISGVRRRKSKLKHLAMTFLKEIIQENDEGHDSIEDSRATLKLVKMKLANSIEFGDEILTQQKRLQELANASSGDNISNNLFAHAAKRDKRTAIVTVGDLQPHLKDIIEKAGEAAPKDHSLAVRVHEVSSSKEAVRKVNEIALENALTIANLQVAEQDFVLESAERSVAKLDKTIDRLWNSVAHNGLFLVLMGGSSECTNGVAKIAIKRLNGTEQISVPIGS